LVASKAIAQRKPKPKVDLTWEERSHLIYARARALLVSHWYVNSHAAATITTGAFEALKTEPSRGYAEAFRTSMLAMMQDPNWPKNKNLPAAHPAIWAPFVLVGKGGSLTNSRTTFRESAPQMP
jgi:hypothetical protein